MLYTRYNGNRFSNGPTPPPPPYTPPPPGRTRGNGGRNPPGRHTPDSDVPSNSQNENKNGLKAGAIIGIVLGSLFAVGLLLLVLVFCLRRGKKKETSPWLPRGSLPVSNDKGSTSLF